MNMNVEISFFEIYNEKIHDLLAPSTKDKTGKKTNVSQLLCRFKLSRCENKRET